MNYLSAETNKVIDRLLDAIELFLNTCANEKHDDETTVQIIGAIVDIGNTILKRADIEKSAAASMRTGYGMGRRPS